MAETMTLREILAIPGLVEAVASATRIAPIVSSMQKLPRSVRVAMLKTAREKGLADDPVVKQITNDIGATVVIEGLDREFLRGPMLRAFERGELDEGHMLVVLSPDQAARSIEIPWKLLVDIEMRWKTEQDLPGEFRIDQKTRVQGRIKANLVSGKTTVTYDLPEVATAS